MNRFAALLDRLAFEHGRNNKIRLMTEYFRIVPDPERGWALAALTGALTFQHAKPGIIRALIAERTDPVLFGLSYDYVGDLSETVALLWPGEREHTASSPGSEPHAERHGRSAPSPLVGEGWGGGLRGRETIVSTHPTPNPSPQGGGEPKQPARLTPTLSEVVAALA